MFTMLSELLTFSVQNGLSQDMLLFLLLLPALGVLIVFFRVVIGLPVPLYRGIFLALAIQSESLGLFYGFAFFVCAVIIDVGVRKLLERWRLLLPARHVFSIFLLSVAALGVFIFAGYFSKETLLTIEFLPLLLILVSAQGILQIHPGDHPLKPVFWLLGMALVLASSFFLLSSPPLHSFILSSPLLFLLLLLFSLLLLARFRGLRLVEYVRFFSIIFRSD